MLGKCCLFRHIFIKLEELQRLGEQGNKGAGLAPFKACAMSDFCDSESHMKAEHLIKIKVVSTSTRIHLLLSYMRMGLCLKYL